MTASVSMRKRRAAMARSASSAWASARGSCMECFPSSRTRAKAPGSKCASPSPRPMISPKGDAALEKTTNPMKLRPRILLADDHTMLLDAFQRLLEPRCEIVGTACDGRALIDLAPSTRPDVIVLDISMPGLNGMDACAQLHRKMPDVKFVFLTVNEDPDIAASDPPGRVGLLAEELRGGRAVHRHRASARGQDLHHAAGHQGRAPRCLPVPGREA